MKIEIQESISETEGKNNFFKKSKIENRNSKEKIFFENRESWIETEGKIFFWISKIENRESNIETGGKKFFFWKSKIENWESKLKGKNFLQIENR